MDTGQGKQEKTDDTNTNAREQFGDSQFYFPYSSLNIRPIKEVIRDLQSQASKYGNPLVLQSRVGIQLEEELVNNMSSVASQSLIPYHSRYPFPLRWKKIFEYLFDKGIIQHPYPSYDKLFHDEPKIYGLRLWAASAQSKTDGKRKDLSTGYSRGVSFDMEEALSKVVGELLERYPLTIYRNKDLISASISELRQKKTHFFDPFLLDQFSPWQKEKFPRYRFDDASRFRWVEGISLMTKKKALIPAQLVYWNYQYDRSEPLLQQPITNGAGGMFTKTEAILSGLYELIQRDAFMVFWLNRIAPPRVDVKSIQDAGVQRAVAMCDRYGIEVHVLDVTSDFGIPATVIVLTDKYGNGPSVALGGGCGFNPGDTIMRGITEAISVRYWLRSVAQNLSYELPNNYEAFTSDEVSARSRLLYWGNPEMQEKIQFFLQGELRSMKESFQNVPDTRMDPEQQLRFLRGIFQKKGKKFEIFYYEAQHEILNTLHYSSVSVSVPALLPLYLDETKAPLGNPRIQEACIALGYQPAEEVNTLPHPFP